MTDPRLARPQWRGRTNVDALTIAWIEHAEAIVRDRWPKIAHPFVITQGGYQGYGGGDPDSADSHAEGGGTDFTWCGHPECLLALRLAGGFAWWRRELWRNGKRVWPNHIHGAPIGHPLMAPVLARQETAYLNGRNGLADNGPDDGPRLNPIPRPTWPWPPEQEYDVISKEDRAAIVKDLLDAPIADDGRTVKKALRQASKAPEVADQVAKRVAALLLHEPGDIAGTFDADQIKAAVKQALREGTDD